ncbi:MAG: hypothetical protein ACE5KJ_08905, partial [Candidatus Zixiibacteriota bacterium]
DAGEYMGEVEGVEVEGESVRSLELERGVKVPKEDLSGVDDVVVVKKRKGKKKTKHHFVWKEVFTELGEFIGRVEDVELDELGEIVKLEAAKGSATRIIAKDDIVGSNGVIMIKAEKEE